MSSFTQCDALAGPGFALIVVLYSCACLACCACGWLVLFEDERTQKKAKKSCCEFWNEDLGKDEDCCPFFLPGCIAFWLSVGLLVTGIVLTATCPFPLELMCGSDVQDCFSHGCTTYEDGNCICRCESGFSSEEGDCSIPDQCSIPVENYASSSSIASQCAVQSNWQLISERYVGDGADCSIDPATGVMFCERRTACADGRPYNRFVHDVTNHRIQTYHCVTECSGSLVSTCCDTCEQAKNDAANGQFKIGGQIIHEVRCPGCSDLQRNADAINCDFTHGGFNCESYDHCSTNQSDVQVTTFHEDFNCTIYPCLNCLDEERGDELRAKCCADCLAILCDPTLNKRIVCDGCEPSELSGASSGPSHGLCETSIEFWA